VPLTLWIAAVAAGIAASAALYVGRRPRGASLSRGWRLLPAVLRAAAATLLVALALDAPVGRAARGRPIAILDASLSWLRGAGSAGRAGAWERARGEARATGGDLWLAGDSVRAAPAPERPADEVTGLRAAVERASAEGRPIAIFTDGEVPDAEGLASLPPDARVRVIAPTRAPDLAIVRVDAPPTAAAGDTLTVRASLAADGAGAPARRLSLQLGGARAVASPTLPLAPYAETTLDLRLPVPPRAAGATLLVAALGGAADGEARNDTLVVAIEVTATPGALFVSTAPDFDARYALAVLRGSLALPATGYFRLAPGVWRDDRTFAQVSEAAVRAAVRAAPVLALHGDTAFFGPPARATTGSVVLVPRFDDRGEEWYASDAPPSPLAAALSGTPWDSLPPVGVSATPPTGEWTGLSTRLGRAGTPRAAIAGREGTRRSVVVAASGLWRWEFRGGASADAFAALWGGIFDWLAEGRSDRRAALPDGAPRAGEPVRWRRGAGDSSEVVVTVAPRGAPARATRVPLRFAPGVTIVESPPLDAGVYDVQAPGGRSVLVVNPSAEWLPRRPTLRSRDAAAGDAAAELRGLRSQPWAYLVLVVLLAVEWLVRRRLALM
jgi:hypothetical protein